MQQVTISVNDAAQMAGVCARTIYRLIDRGELASVKVARRRLVRRDSLARLLNGEAQADAT